MEPEGDYGSQVKAVRTSTPALIFAPIPGTMQQRRWPSGIFRAPRPLLPDLATFAASPRPTMNRFRILSAPGREPVAIKKGFCWPAMFFGALRDFTSRFRPAAWLLLAVTPGLDALAATRKPAPRGSARTDDIL